MRGNGEKLSMYVTYIAPKSKQNHGATEGLLAYNVKGCLNKMCFEMSFKCGKGLHVMSGVVKGIPDS